MVSRILGIDPGSYHLGFGCIEKAGNSIKLISVDVIHAPKKDLFTRLEFLSANLRKLLDNYSPHTLAIEDIFYAKNVRAAFLLGMVRGLVVAHCIERGLKVFEYSPTRVKSVVTGYGKADKEQVKKMVELILNVKIDAGLDATDAVSIALCHAYQKRWGAA